MRLFAIILFGWKIDLAIWQRGVDRGDGILVAVAAVVTTVGLVTTAVLFAAHVNAATAVFTFVVVLSVADVTVAQVGLKVFVAFTIVALLGRAGQVFGIGVVSAALATAEHREIVEKDRLFILRGTIFVRIVLIIRGFSVFFSHDSPPDRHILLPRA